MSEPTKSDLVHRISMLSELCSTSSWQTLNSVFDAINVSDKSTVDLLCYLRTTFYAREHISAYDSLLKRTHAHLKATGQAADKLLQGLTL